MSRTKRSKQAEKLEDARSQFERWLFKNGLSQTVAAGLLQKGKRQIHDYAAGTSQHTGKPIYPDYATRVLMRIIDDGFKPPEPWPEKFDDLHSRLVKSALSAS